MKKLTLHEIGRAETQSPYIVVSDADAIYVRAKTAGAKIVVDIKDRDYGGRGFSCRDLEDHLWNSQPTIHGKHIDFEEFCVSLT